jgi:hypothetical protein
MPFLNIPNLTVPRNGHHEATFSPSVFTGSSLRIELDARNLGANSDKIAIDNLIFGQVAIPEPSTVSMVMLALLCGAGAVLRKAARPADRTR